jgi:cytidine deaminase
MQACAEMTTEDLKLIEAAKAVLGRFKLRKNYDAGQVAAAIRTANGNIYTGICLDLGCGLGFCAEVAAIADMLKNRETLIEAMVALDQRGSPIAPCGRCRETMLQVDERNVKCRVILPNDRQVILQELLPDHWLDGYQSA